MLNALYNQVDEEVHKLVILSNKSQKQLESLLEVHKFEEQTQQVSLNYFPPDINICAAVFWYSMEIINKQTPSPSRSNSGSVVRERSSSHLWNP